MTGIPGEKYGRQKLVLDYARTIAIILGIFFAVAELYNAAGDKARLRFENTQEMLTGFGREDLIESAISLINYGKMETTETNYNALLAKLTPLRQHLIAWTTCIEFEMCEDAKSIKILCRRLVVYEFSFWTIQARFGRTYDGPRRDEQTFGKVGWCLVNDKDAIMQSISGGFSEQFLKE